MVSDIQGQYNKSQKHWGNHSASLRMQSGCTISKLDRLKLRHILAKERIYLILPNEEEKGNASKTNESKISNTSYLITYSHFI